MQYADDTTLYACMDKYTLKCLQSGFIIGLKNLTKLTNKTKVLKFSLDRGVDNDTMSFLVSGSLREH